MLDILPVVANPEFDVDFDDVNISATPTEVVRTFRQLSGKGPRLLLMDEIQSCKDWVKEIKFLTDHYKDISIVVTGSAMTVSAEEQASVGLGRFFNCYVPPLLFCEFLDYTESWPKNLSRNASLEECLAMKFSNSEINNLNKKFMEYLDYGAYPELVLSGSVRQLTERKKILRTIVYETVLGHGTLKGFEAHHRARLRKVFSYLVAMNGKETNIGSITQHVEGLSRDIIEKYLQDLVSSFLISELKKIGSSSEKELLIKRNSKYLICNPSLPELIFGTLAKDKSSKGHLAEAATIVQHLIHNDSENVRSYYYCNYMLNRKNIEVDIMRTNSFILDDIDLLCEVKWSDNKSNVRKGINSVLSAHKKFKQRILDDARLICTTKTTYSDENENQVLLIPTAQYSLAQGLESLKARFASSNPDPQ